MVAEARDGQMRPGRMSAVGDRIAWLMSNALPGIRQGILFHAEPSAMQALREVHSAMVGDKR